MANVSRIVGLTGLAALCGCTTTPPASVVDGSGFQMLHPSSATRKFIVANDLDFAREIVSHNSFCQSQSGCRKGN